MTTIEVLWLCFEHFAHLDESNAAIHCSEVRYSPLTFRLAEELRGSGDPDSGERDRLLLKVLHHVNKYEEDKGR